MFTFRIDHTSPKNHAFDVEFSLTVRDTTPYDVFEQTLGAWITETFTHHFVLMCIGHRLVAGGAVDNRAAWKDMIQNNEKTDPWSPSNAYFDYTLRCYKEDAMVFMLKYGAHKE